jgi:hypothetical protein
MKLGLTMRKALIWTVHVKRIWNQEEDISPLGSSLLPDPQLPRIKPSAEKRKEEHLKYENP